MARKHLRNFTTIISSGGLEGRRNRTVTFRNCTIIIIFQVSSSYREFHGYNYFRDSLVATEKTGSIDGISRLYLFSRLSGGYGIERQH